MNSGSWAAYQSALSLEARSAGEPDDGPAAAPLEPARLKADAPPYGFTVCHVGEAAFTDLDTGRVTIHAVPIGRAFGAESWRRKHVAAWKAAMERRHGKGDVWVEESF